MIFDFGVSDAYAFVIASHRNRHHAANMRHQAFLRPLTYPYLLLAIARNTTQLRWHAIASIIDRLAFKYISAAISIESRRHLRGPERPCAELAMAEGI